MAQRFDTLIAGGTLVTSSGRRRADVGIADGRIVIVAPAGALDPAGATTIKAAGLHVLPGMIDGHVHFREPGLTYKEDWLTGSRAAVMGGVTTVLEMPNTVPPTDSAERAENKAQLAAARSYCDFGLFGLLGADSTERLEPLFRSPSIVGLKVFLGPTTGDLQPPAEEHLLHGLRAAAQAGFRVAFHAEDRQLIDEAGAAVRAAGRRDALAHLASRPAEAEARAIDHVGRLLAETGARGHVLHLSSAEGLAAVERWRGQGVDLSCEVSAHHCFLSADDYARLGGLLKCNPPVREPVHGAALVSALAHHRIDCIASDHAPHAPDEKRATEIWQVPAGVAGVETTLPLFLRAVADGRLTIETLVRAFAERPAQLWGLWPAKGSLEPGADADLVLLDLSRPGVVSADALHGRHALTPFEGWPTGGEVVGTLVRGRLVAWQGELLGEAGWGRQVRPAATPAA